MKDDVEFVILKCQSWLDATDFENKILGAIVQEFLKPTNNYVPESPLNYNTASLVEGALADFKLASSSSTGRVVAARLKSVAGFSFGGNTEEMVNLEGKVIRYKRLQQHDQFWAKLKLDPVVRSTVPGWISFFNTWPVCLVVGIMTCEDSNLLLSSSKIVKGKAKAEFPLKLINAASSMPVSIVNASYPEVEASTTANLEQALKGSVSKRYIFALELKKVTTKLLRRKELELSNLGPCVDAVRRAGHNSEDDDDDISERVCVDDLILESLTQEEIVEMVG